MSDFAVKKVNLSEIGLLWRNSCRYTAHYRTNIMSSTKLEVYNVSQRRRGRTQLRP